jgi:DNA-directed RNA polymerase subunit RPC12/RpoP
MVNTKKDTFQCSHCGRELQLPDSTKEIIGRCPYCEYLVVVQPSIKDMDPASLSS